MLYTIQTALAGGGSRVQLTVSSSEAVESFTARARLLVHTATMPWLVPLHGVSPSMVRYVFLAPQLAYQALNNTDTLYIKH